MHIKEILHVVALLFFSSHFSHSKRATFTSIWELHNKWDFKGATGKKNSIGPDYVLGPGRQQGITWIHIDQVLWCHLVTLVHKHQIDCNVTYGINQP